MTGEWMYGRLPAHEHAGGAARSLGEDGDVGARGLVDEREDLLPQLGRLVGLLEVEAHPHARLARRRVHPGELLIHAAVIRRHLEDAAAALGETARESAQLGL